ncbi:MAG: transglutaminase family protein [candidate division WOR-3 bacterium]|nr:transglutaminase family protein [candidate division WOR-3 bacterium]
MKRLITILITCVVAGITIFLFKTLYKSNEEIAIKSTPAEYVKEVSEEYLGIFIHGQRVGHTFTKIKTLHSGLEIETSSQMTINMMDEITTLNTYLFARTDTTYALENFSISIDARGHESKIEGIIKGNKLQITTHSRGVKQTQIRDIKEKPYIPDVIDILVKRKNLQPGDEITLPYFDPTSQSTGKAKIKIHPRQKVKVFDKEIEGKKIEINFMGIVSYVWLDENNRIIKNETPNLYMEMIPLTKEEALKEVKPQEAFDLLGFFSIKLSNPLPQDKKISYVKLELSDITLEGLDLEDDFQKVISKDPLIIEVSKADINQLTPLFVPINENTEFLKPSAYIQCTHPDIIKEAKRIAGKEKSAINITKRLTNSVYQAIAKVPTPSMPSAIDVLKTKEGDCNEHSILFTALSRALGIPTKIYVGLVNLEGNAYFYHAWCAVWLGKWVPVDPTFNQFPADVYHLKLKEGEISDWAEVMKVVGRLKIKVLEYH